MKPVNPINKLEVGESIIMALYDFGTSPPNVAAYQIAQRTGKKFKCRKTGQLMTWKVERVE